MRTGLAHLGVIGYIAASSALAFFFPQSVLAFLLFEASLLVIYYAPFGSRAKFYWGTLVLLVLLPLLGSVNGYYLEVAIQVGIFVALALGLNIVVGFVGLLNLGFVAFYAIGAYLWAIFGSPGESIYSRQLVSTCAILVFSVSPAKRRPGRTDGNFAGAAGAASAR